MGIKEKIINRLKEEAQKELDECMSIINDFAKPLDIPSPLEPVQRAEYFEERINGRLSSKSHQNAWEKRLEIDNFLHELINLEYRLSRGG